MQRILILNGSLGGSSGNTAAAIELLTPLLSRSAQVETVHLKNILAVELLNEKIRSADGFVFTSGTYWDSWGSPLQRFLEQATDLEASECLLGKPASVIVTMHSVGGKEVLSRLQGVLSTLGLFIPPMSAMVYSFANQLALMSLASSSVQDKELSADLWRLDDLTVIAANLLAALQLAPTGNWATWPVDTSDPHRRWLKS